MAVILLFLYRHVFPRSRLHSILVLFLLTPKYIFCFQKLETCQDATFTRSYWWIVAGFQGCAMMTGKTGIIFYLCSPDSPQTVCFLMTTDSALAEQRLPHRRHHSRSLLIDNYCFMLESMDISFIVLKSLAFDVWLTLDSDIKN